MERKPLARAARPKQRRAKMAGNARRAKHHAHAADFGGFVRCAGQGRGGGMKNIILDHFRRWWWVLALGAAYALLLGWSMAIPTDAGDLGHGKKVSGLTLIFFVWLKVQGTLFVMQVFCLTAFTGAMLL